MAIKLINKDRVISDAEYPFGKIVNESSPGRGDGVPVNAAVYQDFHQVWAKILDESGQGYSGQVDNGTTRNDYFDGLTKWIGLSVRALNFSATSVGDDVTVGVSELTLVNGNITLPSDGITRSIQVIGKIVVNRDEITQVDSRLTYNLKDLNDNILDTSFIGTGLIEIEGSVVVVYSFTHAGNGGGFKQTVKSQNADDYLISNAIMNVIGLPV